MKIVCEVCRVEGYLQHISQNYYRVRHYVGVENGKPRFEYHKQSFQYVQRFLNQKPSAIDPIDLKTIDPKLLNNSSFNEFSSRGSLAWPGRQTHNLENKKGQHAYGPEVAGSNPAPLVEHASIRANGTKRVLLPR